MSAPLVLDRPDIVHQVVCDVLCDIFPTVSEGLLFRDGRGAASCAWVRQVGMYILVERLEVSMKQTARRFGRDRTTVMHATRLVARRIGENRTTAAFLGFLEAQVLERLNRLAADDANWEGPSGA